MENLRVLSHLESVESTDAIWHPLFVRLTFLPIVIWMVMECSRQDNFPIVGLISLVFAFLALCVLRKFRLTDFHWKTDTNGLHIKGFLRDQSILWSDIKRARVVRANSGHWRAYILKTGGKDVLIPVVDGYLEASIWQHLNTFGLAHGLQLSKNALLVWHDRQISSPSSKSRYCDIPFLNSVSSNKLLFLKSLAVGGTVLMLVAIVCGAATVLIGGSYVLIFTGLADLAILFIMEIGVVLLVMLFQLADAWHVWEWCQHTDSCGYSLRKFGQKIFIPWSEVRAVRRNEDADYSGFGWELITPRYSVIVPECDPAILASTWQHLKLNGVIQDSDPPENLRIFWKRSSDSAHQGTGAADGLRKLPELESVESEDVLWSPLMIGLLFMTPVLMLTVRFILGGYGPSLHPFAVGSISFAFACAVLAALRVVGLTDSYWKTDAEGLLVKGFRRHGRICWDDIKSANVTRSVFGSWRYYLLKTESSSILIPTTDSYLEASIWQHLNDRRLADSIQPSKAACEAWVEKSPTRVTEDLRYLHLQMLNSISGPGWQFEQLLMVTSNLAIAAILFLLVFAAIGMSSMFRLITNLLVSQIFIVVFILLVQFVYREHGWECQRRISRRGYSLRILWDNIFIPWSDMKAVSLKQDASLYDAGWVLTTDRHAVMLPTRNRAFAAAAWQYLRMNGIINDPEPPNDLKVFWSPIVGRAPEGTEWTCPQDLSKAWAFDWKFIVGWSLPSIALILVYVHSFIRYYPHLDVNPGSIIWVFWIVYLFVREYRHRRWLLAHSARHLELRYEALRVVTTEGEFESAWESVRSAEWIRNDRDPYLKLRLADGQEVGIVLDKKDTTSWPLILGVIDELRNAGNPCVVGIFNNQLLFRDNHVTQPA